MRARTVRVFADLAKAFRAIDVRWYVFGAQAVIAAGAPRLTDDIDVTVELPSGGARSVVKVLAKHGIRLRDVGEVDTFIARTRVIPAVHVASGMPVDVVLAGPGLEMEMLARALPSSALPSMTQRWSRHSTPSSARRRSDRLLRMGSSFTMVHEFDCDLERFWKIFFDEAVTKATYAHLGFPKWELVEQRDTDKEIVRKVKAVPKLDLPGPVKKVLGDGFGYTEEGRFDKEKKEYKFVITPTTLADKLKNEGKVRAEAIDGGKRTKRTVDVTIEAKVFGIGGMIEKTTEKGTRDGWTDGAKFLNDWIKKNPA